VRDFGASGIPRGLAVGRNNTLYIAGDDSIAEASLGVIPAKPVVIVASRPNEQLVAEGVAVGPEGSLYFTAFYGGVFHISMPEGGVSKVGNTTYGTFGMDIRDTKHAAELYVVTNDDGIEEHSDILAWNVETGMERVVCRSCTDSSGIAVVPGAIETSPTQAQCQRSVDCEDVTNDCGTYTPFCDHDSHVCMPDVRRCSDVPDVCKLIRITERGQCAPFHCDAIGFCVPPLK